MDTLGSPSLTLLSPSTDCPSPERALDRSPAVVSVGGSADSVGPPSRRRTAEKNRRLTTNTFFDQLVTLLSITGGDSDIHKKQDKASILCNARNYVRFYHDLSTFHGSSSASLPGPSAVRQVSPSASPPTPPVHARRKVDPKKLRCHNSGTLTEHLLHACNGFLLIIVPPGRVMYSSNTILSSLGVSSSMVAGQLLSTIVTQEDAQSILDSSSLAQLPEKTQDGQQIICYPRSRARYRFHRSASLTTAMPEPLSFTCSTYLRRWKDSAASSSDASVGTLTTSAAPFNHCYVLVGTSDTLSFPDSSLAMDDEFKFELRISKGGRIIEVQKHATIAIGFTTSELIGASIFDFVHPYHVIAFGEAIQSFTTRGCGTTNLYRLFTKGGQWLWCSTRGFIACNPWNHDIDHIVLEVKILGTNQVDSQLRNSIDPLYLPRSDEPEWCGQCVPPQQTEELPPASATPRPPKTNPAIDSMQQRLKELEKELQMKNSALFDSQIRLLEQQNLLNQERKKFVDLTKVLVKELHPPAQPTGTGYSYCKEPLHMDSSGYPSSTTHHYAQAMPQPTPSLHPPLPPAAAPMYCTSTQPVVGPPIDKINSVDTLDLGLDFITDLCGDQLFQTFPSNPQDPNARLS